MDTTYFGRTFGIMVFKDSITGQILFKQYVKQETNKLYLFGIEEITRRGIKIPPAEPTSVLFDKAKVGTIFIKVLNDKNKHHSLCPLEQNTYKIPFFLYITPKKY